MNSKEAFYLPGTCALLAVWLACLLYVRVRSGDSEARSGSRQVAAFAFLLYLIGFFGWPIYASSRPAANPPSQEDRKEPPHLPPVESSQRQRTSPEGE
jgi:hypothetical protein